MLTDVLAAELDLSDIDGLKDVSGQEAAFAFTYGATINDGWLNWDLGAGRKAQTLANPVADALTGIRNHRNQPAHQADLPAIRAYARETEQVEGQQTPVSDRA